MNKMFCPKHLSNWKILLLYCIVSFFLFFEMAIQVSPSVMSSQLMTDLHIGTFGLGIMSGVYFYTYTAMQIPSGILFDRFNPRIIITVAILICALGTWIFSVSHNVCISGLARMLMGCGSAFAFVSVLVVTADLFKSTYFATMTGVTQALAALGAMTGQMPVSSLVTIFGWRHTMLMLAAIGLVLAVIVFKCLKYERVRSYSPHKVNTKENLKKVISEPQTWVIALYACLMWVPMSSFASLWGVPFLVSVHHLQQENAAFICSLMWLGLALASPLLGMLSGLFENKVMSLAFSALLGVVTFGFVLISNYSALVMGAALFLAGASCAGQALSFTVVKDNNLRSVRATAIAFNNMAVVISGAVFQPLIGKFIEVGTGAAPGVYNEKSFTYGLSIIWFAYLASFLIAFLFIKKQGVNRG